MTDLAALVAAQNNQQQPPQQQAPLVPPNIFAPVAVGVEAVTLPNGDGFVAVHVQNQHGSFIFAMDAASATSVAARIAGAARVSKTGLTIVGDPLGPRSDNIIDVPTAGTAVAAE